ncbi:hypothetical protein GCM10009824_02060 [Kocuria atrinae]|uniref:ATP synthase protein I n=1 Tax=Kocuria atrinae TaxID=592377 RepID=A0ABN2XAV9_9MICC
MSHAVPASAHSASSEPTAEPPEAYGRSVLVLSVTSILLAVILLTCAAVIEFDPLWRSIAVGGGLVMLSTGLTVFMSALMYRVAPAATAPALALLYLLKVVVMGWYLIFVGAPEWLQTRGFAITVAAGLVVSWLGLAPVAMRASTVLASDYAAAVRAKQEQEAAEQKAAADQGENSSPTTLDNRATEPTEGEDHGQA